MPGQLLTEYLAITASNNLMTVRRKFTAPNTKLAKGG
jgi:hypothetical protein